jgi:hypothetical protein
VEPFSGSAEMPLLGRSPTTPRAWNPPRPGGATTTGPSSRVRLTVGVAPATGSTSAGLSSAPLAVARVGEPADVAALAVHLMTNTALTGARYDIDGGQQLVG